MYVTHLVVLVNDFVHGGGVVRRILHQAAALFGYLSEVVEEIAADRRDASLHSPGRMKSHNSFHSIAKTPLYLCTIPSQSHHKTFITN